MLQCEKLSGELQLSFTVLKTISSADQGYIVTWVILSRGSGLLHEGRLCKFVLTRDCYTGTWLVVMVTRDCYTGIWLVVMVTRDCYTGIWLVAMVIG